MVESRVSCIEKLIMIYMFDVVIKESVTKFVGKNLKIIFFMTIPDSL